MTYAQRQDVRPPEFHRNDIKERIRQECEAEIRELRETTELATQTLPIEEQKEAFVDALTRHPVISVEASTGAGKSLDLGVWVVEHLGGKNARVAMTQPRRDAAEGVALATAARHNLSFGNDVCFSTSEFHGNTDSTKLQIQTTGISTGSSFRILRCGYCRRST